MTITIAKQRMSWDELYQRAYHLFAGRLTCREMTEAVTDYLEGRLEPGLRLRFQRHVGLCLGCRIYVRQMRTTRRVMMRLPAAPAPAAIRDGLVQRFLTWKSIGAG